jgi:hypothetical protein
MLTKVPANHARASPTERFIATSCSTQEERGLSEG